jgi:hypothetical protein
MDEVRDAAYSLTAPAPGLAGHTSAAALDWRLREVNGNFLDAGNPYPEGGAISSMWFPYLLPQEWKARQLFLHIMRAVGMKILPTEDWHASFGDIGLGIHGKRPSHAFYGPVRSFDESGEICASPPPYYLDYLSTEGLATIVEIARDGWRGQRPSKASEYDGAAMSKIVLALRDSSLGGSRAELFKKWPA